MSGLENSWIDQSFLEIFAHTFSSSSSIFFDTIKYNDYIALQNICSCVYQT